MEQIFTERNEMTWHGEERREEERKCPSREFNVYLARPYQV